MMKKSVFCILQVITFTLTTADIQKDFFAAVQSDNLAMVDQLIKDKGINPNLKDGRGDTALHIAAQNRNLRIVQYLLNLTDIAGNRIVNPNALGTYNKTALHFITGYNPKLSSELQNRNGAEITEALLQAGINPDLKDNYGWAAIHYAAKHGKESIIRLLLAHGANPNIRLSDNTTAWGLAMLNNHPNITLMLLPAITAALPVNFHPNDLDRLLMTAVSSEDLDSALLYLEHGADPSKAMQAIRTVDDSDLFDDRRVKDKNPMMRALLNFYLRSTDVRKKALEQKQLDFDAFDKKQGPRLYNPDDLDRLLCEAVAQNDVYQVRKLLELGANPKASNPNKKDSREKFADAFTEIKRIRKGESVWSQGWEEDENSEIRPLLEEYVTVPSMSAFKDMRVSMKLDGKTTSFETDVVNAYKQYEIGNGEALENLLKNSSTSEQVQSLFHPKVLQKIDKKLKSLKKNKDLKAEFFYAQQRQINPQLQSAHEQIVQLFNPNPVRGSLNTQSDCNMGNKEQGPKKCDTNDLD